MLKYFHSDYGLLCSIAVDSVFGEEGVVFATFVFLAVTCMLHVS
jgi:hypothetical protein